MPMIMNVSVNSRVLPLLAALSFNVCAAADTTLCRPDERVQFACSTGQKMVALCARPGAGTLEALTYRFGKPEAVELEFEATRSNRRRFYATTETIHPRAHVEQVWFDRGNLRYLLTHCVGGACPYPAGIAVLRLDNERFLMQGRCAGPGSENMEFSTDLVDFGDGIAGGKSKSDLLIWGKYGHPVHKLYPTPSAN